MDLECIILSEVTQSQKIQIFSHIQNLANNVYMCK